MLNFGKETKEKMSITALIIGLSFSVILISIGVYTKIKKLEQRIKDIENK